MSRHPASGPACDADEAKERQVSGEHDRIYDSFVLRVWHDGTANDLLRAEIEHVQTGEAHHAAAVSLSWILDQIRAILLTIHFPDEPSEDNA